MILTINLADKWISMRKWMYGTSILLCIIIFISACFYLFTGYYHLVDWYLGLNNCFFQSSTWSTNFFTQSVKSAGNMYCLTAMAIAAAGSWYAYQRIKSNSKLASESPAVRLNLIELVPAVACLVTATASWVCGKRLAMPAADEVFSAQNVAGINLFQGLSYYMAPNNHLFFNLLNHLLFPTAADQVATGRLISLACYYAFIMVTFSGFRCVLQNRWLAMLATITISLQFFTWGFSFQARGYELYLLAECGMCLSLILYLFSMRSAWLYLNTCCIVVGYFCLPSFLYFHAAQLVFMLVYRAVQRDKTLTFWKHQFASGLLTFLCYLPVLCFSGLKSISANPYVSPMENKTVSSFWQQMWPVLKTQYIGHVFSDMHVQGHNIGYILCLLPIMLVLAGRNKKYQLYGFFYLSVLVCYFVLTSLMKRLPFERNLIGHYSLALGGVLLVAAWLADMLKERANAARWIMIPLVSAIFSVHFIRTNEKYLVDTLYEYDVNKVYKEQDAWLHAVPAGSTVTFSDAEFYSYYICKKNGCKVSKCADGSETYYVKQESEAFAPIAAGKYVLADKLYGYELYKLKQ